ncbi:hypothetical protein Lser_V15G34706 [Lactuca serriola]
MGSTLWIHHDSFKYGSTLKERDTVEIYRARPHRALNCGVEWRMPPKSEEAKRFSP